MWPFKRRKRSDVNTPVTNPGLKKAFKGFSQNKNETTLKHLENELKAAQFLVLIKKKWLKNIAANNRWCRYVRERQYYKIS